MTSLQRITKAGLQRIEELREMAHVWDEEDQGRPWEETDEARELEVLERAAEQVAQS